MCVIVCNHRGYSSGIRVTTAFRSRADDDACIRVTPFLIIFHWINERGKISGNSRTFICTQLIAIKPVNPFVNWSQQKWLLVHFFLSFSLFPCLYENQANQINRIAAKKTSLISQLQCIRSIENIRTGYFSVLFSFWKYCIHWDETMMDAYCVWTLCIFIRCVQYEKWHKYRIYYSIFSIREVHSLARSMHAYECLCESTTYATEWVTWFEIWNIAMFQLVFSHFPDDYGICAAPFATIGFWQTYACQRYVHTKYVFTNRMCISILWIY